MTGSLQIKNGKYYAVINLTDKNGKRKNMNKAKILRERICFLRIISAFGWNVQK